MNQVIEPYKSYESGYEACESYESGYEACESYESGNEPYESYESGNEPYESYESGYEQCEGDPQVLPGSVEAVVGTHSVVTEQSLGSLSSTLCNTQLQSYQHG